MYCRFVQKGTMGNVVQCCHTLSNYFKCKDAPAQGEAERSPLLSSEESECESPSLMDNLEDDLLTVSTGVTNPTLEPEHFLFPDIILSSNPGGDMTLVEPMVCLLVCEEEEGARVDEPGDEGQERSNRGRNRGYSEVETQTEMETQIGMGVQTQTESLADIQAQTEVLNKETVEGEVNTLTCTGTTKEMRVDVWGEHETLKQVDVLFEAQTDKQTSQERRSEIVTETPPGTWSDIEVPEKRERKVEKNKLALGDIGKEAEQEVKEKHIHKELSTTSTKHTFQTEQNTELIQDLNTDEENVVKLQQNTVAAQENTVFAWTENHSLQTQENVKDKEQHNDSDCTSVRLTEHNVNSMNENVAAVESQTDVQSTKYSIKNTEVDPAEHRVDLIQLNEQDYEQMGQPTVVSHQNVNEKDHNTKTNIHPSEGYTHQTADQSVLNTDHIQCQENLHPQKREEDDSKTGLRHVLELVTALPQVEEEEAAEMQQITVFSVDRLFLAAPHVKGV